MTWETESTLGSEAMDFSRGEKGHDSHSKQVPGLTTVGSATRHYSRWNEGVRNRSILVFPTLSESPKRIWEFGSKLMPVRQPISRSRRAPQASTPFSQRVSNMRRSRFGEAYSYKELRQIGSGGFGNCFLLERSTDNDLRVCKVQQRAYCYKRDDYEVAPIEASILWDILPPHDRILRLHEVIIQTHTVQLYYDFYDGGDLNQLIRSYRDQWQQIPEEFLWHAYQQVSEALAFIHHGYDRRNQCRPPADWTSIIHGDVKDKNIFLGPPDPFSDDPLAREYPSLVLGDFGLADLHPSRRWGTLIRQPPELPMLSKKSDVWGAGAVIHSLAHEGKPPILELPNRASNVTWEEWYENPDSRQGTPLFPRYSHELQDCVSNALDVDPVRRFNSYQLYSKVTAVWNVQMAPYLDAVPSLIPPAAYKEYDENGVTLNTKDRDLASEQDTAAQDAFRAKTSFKDGKVLRPHESIKHPVIAATADWFAANISIPSYLSALAVERQMIAKEAIREDNAATAIVEKAFVADNYVRQKDFASASMEMKGLSQTLPPTFYEGNNSRNDITAFGHAIDAFELQAVAAVVCDGMIYDEDGTNAYEYGAFDDGGVTRTESHDKQLDTALWGTVGGGTNFDMDPTGCFIEAGEGMYIFGTDTHTPSQPVRMETDNDAVPVDPTGWCIDPGAGLNDFDSTSHDTAMVDVCSLYAWDLDYECF